MEGTEDQRLADLKKLAIKCEYSLFCRMEGQGEYQLPPSLETKYVGEMKDGM